MKIHIFWPILITATIAAFVIEYLLLGHIEEWHQSILELAIFMAGYYIGRY